MFKPWNNLASAVPVLCHTRLITIVAVLLVVSNFAYGQRRATRPAQKPATSAPTEATQRHVSITLKTGETVTGNLVSADASLVHVQVGANNLTIKWDEIVTIRTGDASTNQPNPDQAKQQQDTAKTSLLPIEVALIFNSGDVKPAARTNFILLDEDLNVILNPFPRMLSSNWGQGPPITAYMFDSELSRMEMYAGGVEDDIRRGNPYHMSRERAAEVIAEVREIRKAVAAHIIASVTTDFNGKATFEGVPVGEAFLFGTFKAGNNEMSWHMPVALKPGTNPKLTLSNDNSIVPTQNDIR